jgi:predicted amidohydrolase
MEILIMRVAVSQFATTLNTQENLATCLRMINEVATCEPSIIVLPEYCNTLPSYTCHDQAWHEALAIDGVFLQQIAEQAKKHACYIVINVTLRRDSLRELSSNQQNGTIKSNISVTTCVFSPLGELVQQTDKQNLSEHENKFFISANKIAKTLATPLGKLGFLSGCDNLIFSISRSLALDGVQLLCNPMSSFAFDQNNLYGLARASENKVFIATANKIGSLFSSSFSAQPFTPQEYLIGTGQSQIVAPNGKVLAKLTGNEEGFVFADINMAECSLSNKLRPDGTCIIKQQRPELYHERVLSLKKAPQHEQGNKVPETANVAIFATYKTNECAIEDVCHYIENNLSDIIQLPELFFIADKEITNDTQKISQIACLSKQLITDISSMLRPCQYVCTSLVLEGVHQAVIISEHGLFATQQQLHFCQRYQWTILGDNVNIIELPLEQGNIKVAMLTADDANIPEIIDVVASSGIHLLLVPFDIQEPSEVEFHLLSRAAEHRICILAATREKSFEHNLSIDDDAHTHLKNNKKKIKTQKFTGLIANFITEKALLAQWKSGQFNGYINQPLVKYQQGKITKAVIFPIAACGNNDLINKL